METIMKQSVVFISVSVSLLRLALAVLWYKCSLRWKIQTECINRERMENVSYSNLGQ